MSTEGNKAVVRRVFDEVINQGHLNVADETMSNDYVYRSPGSPDLHGPEGFKQLVTMYRSACPDVHLDIDEQFADGDSVVTRWTGHGTQLGDFMGIPPTGKRVTVTGIIITHLKDGKAADEWEIMDTLGLLQQLGAIPDADAAVAAVG